MQEAIARRCLRAGDAPTPAPAIAKLELPASHVHPRAESVSAAPGLRVRPRTHARTLERIDPEYPPVNRCPCH